MYIVRVQGNSLKVNYIARVDIIDDLEYEGVFFCMYLYGYAQFSNFWQLVNRKRVQAKNHFFINLDDNTSFVKEDIVVKLHPANFLGGSYHRKDQFNVICNY